MPGVPQPIVEAGPEELSASDEQRVRQAIYRFAERIFMRSGPRTLTTASPPPKETP